MNFLAHRGLWVAPDERNTLPAFRRAFERGFGAEVDVRDRDGELVVSHDPPGAGALPFAAVVSAWRDAGCAGPLAVNVKSDGLQDALARELDGAQNWFLFDMSVPDAVVSVRRGLPVFTRHSDVEPDPVLYDQAEGVWLDDFHGGWLGERHVQRHLDAGKRVAIVSPELHDRAPTPSWRGWTIWSDPRVLLCTDFPEQAREALS